jgi:hypothetical protein
MALFCFWGLINGKKKMKRSMTPIPIGMLMKKIQCQETRSVISPPRVGPIIEDSPKTPLINP